MNRLEQFTETWLHSAWLWWTWFYSHLHELSSSDGGKQPPPFSFTPPFSFDLLKKISQLLVLHVSHLELFLGIVTNHLQP